MIKTPSQAPEQPKRIEQEEEDADVLVLELSRSDSLYQESLQFEENLVLDLPRWNRYGV